MSIILNEERVMLPRWRMFYNTINFDELNYANFGNKNNTLISREERIDHINAIEEWRAKNNIENAIELCASSIVNGSFDDAKESASFILDDKPCSKSVIAMAKKILNPDQNIGNAPLDDPRSRIANLRKKIHRSPANSILWVDIALEYAILGQNDKAERAIKNALILAPHNRFVVRCAARFFMHINKISEARRFVENYQFIKQDPWILAIELSISYKQKRTSKYLKLSKNAIEKGRIPLFHSSELASALGVTEIYSGANKKALKLFRHSLQDPTDNSIAQAQWIKDEHKLNILLDAKTIAKDTAHEAESYQFGQSGEWGNFMKSANKWARYEPYSTRSFAYMSYVSLVCQDNIDKSIGYSNKGLILSKNEFGFLNSMVIAYAQQGKLENAEKKFSFIKEQNLSEGDKFVYTATKGLLKFRHKKIEEGRYLYHDAIQQIISLEYRNKKAENLAMLFWAREEIVAKTDIAHSFFDEVKKKIKYEQNKDILAFKEIIEKALPPK